MTVYTESDVEVTFWVRAVNNAGNISEPRIRNLTTAFFSKPFYQMYAICTSL